MAGGLQSRTIVISAPEDYGMTAEQTLAHRGDAQLPDGFEAYWSRMSEAAAAMPRRLQGTLTDPVNQIVLRSLDDVRVVGWLHLPESSPHGLVVTTHGYVVEDEPAEEDGDRVERWTARGLACLRLRVRGFPPSTADVDALGANWILHRIESREDWIMRGAVVDVVTACRALRAHLPGLPLHLHGESFGGGLAVLAASLLTRLGAPPDRLVAALPSLGDWPWRAGRYCNGSGARVNVLVESLRQEGRAVSATLRLFDAVLHAARVRCPTLAKLATLDDTVPAPAAAAVVNALAGRPLWRFVTRYGHFDGGIADARRHALFRHIEAEFLDPAVAAEELGSRHPGQLDPQPPAG